MAPRSSTLIAEPYEVEGVASPEAIQRLFDIDSVRAKKVGRLVDEAFAKASSRSRPTAQRSPSAPAKRQKKRSTKR